MDKPTFRQIVLHWKDQRGQIPTNPENRIEAFLDLFEALVFHGFTKQDINMIPNKGFIVHQSHNPHHSKSEKRKIWQEMVEDDLEKALLRKWEIEMPTHDSTKSAFKKVEYAPAEPKEVAPEEPVEVAPVGKAFSDEEWSKMKKPEPVYDSELRLLLGFTDE